MIQKLCGISYALAVLALIGGTCWAAGGMKSDRQHSSGGVGIVLLAALQH